MREILPPGTLGNALRRFQRSHLGWGVGLLVSSGTEDPGRFCAFLQSYNKPVVEMGKSLLETPVLFPRLNQT